MGRRGYLLSTQGPLLREDECNGDITTVGRECMALHSPLVTFRRLVRNTCLMLRAHSPPKGTSPNQATLVVHRGQAQAVRIAGRGSNSTCRLGANHPVIGCAERLGTRHVRQRPGRGIEIPARQSCAARRHSKGVAALTGTSRRTVLSQVVIDQATAGRQRNARRRCPAQGSQRGIAKVYRQQRSHFAKRSW
jgi:hypothetical protein